MLLEATIHVLKQLNEETRQRETALNFTELDKRESWEEYIFVSEIQSLQSGISCEGES